MTDIPRDALRSEWMSGFETNFDSLLKISEIADADPDSVALVLDWDGVLTVKETDGISGTTWDVLRASMTPENRSLHTELFERYRDLERNGGLSTAQAYRWQKQSMRLLAGASEDKIQADARDMIVLRDGVVELFETCHKYDIPPFIKSAGAKLAIQAVVEQYDLRPAHIYSNEFHSVDGILNSVKPESLVHSLNKHAYPHTRHPAGKGRRTSIAVGDNPHDAHMIQGGQRAQPSRSLLIRLDGGKDKHVAGNGLAGWQEYVADSFRNFDMVAIEDNAFALTALVATIGENRLAA